MKDYSFAEAIEEAAPRIQAAMAHIADQMQGYIKDLLAWWEPRREAFLNQRDTLDEYSRNLGDSFEELRRATKEAQG